MRSEFRRASVLLAFIAGACSGSTSQDDPRPTSVVPNAGYNTAATAVEISGTQFLVKATQPSGGGSAQLDTRSRAWLGDVELADVTWVSTEKLTATVPAGLPAGVHKLTVENAVGHRGTLDGAFTVLSPPAFSATVSAAPTTVSVGQAFSLTLTLSNNGSTDLSSVALGAPVLTPADLASISPGGSPTSPAAPLAPGTSQNFTWTFVASAPGPLAITFGPTAATDALAGQALSATPPAAAQVNVQRAATLTTTLSVPASVFVGADFPVTMTVTNTGEAAATDVTPGTPSLVSGSAGAAVLKPGTGAVPASATIAAGQSVIFGWTYNATAFGQLRLSAAADGTDANSGLAVTSAAATSDPAAITNAAIVAAITSVPASVSVGQTFLVVVTFSNPGASAVSSFVPQSSLAPVLGPVPPTPTLPAHSNNNGVTWGFTPSSPGKLTISFTGTGRDDGTGFFVTGSATATIDVVP